MKIQKVALFCLLSLSFFFSETVPLCAGDEIRVSCRSVQKNNKDGKERWQLLVMAKAEKTMTNSAPKIEVPDSLKVESIFPEKADIFSDHFTMFYVSIVGNPSSSNEPVKISLSSRFDSKIEVSLISGSSLLEQPWQSYYVGEGSKLADVKAVPGSDVQWNELRLPKLWDEIGVTWIRTNVFVPETWKPLDVALVISAVDDNEISFVNGKEIGRTKGWDVLRNYDIPKDLLKYGEMNEIAVAVENVNAGGGIAGAPIWFGQKIKHEKAIQLFPKPEYQKEADRKKPHKQGKASPLRPMLVRDGVLEYADGGEVALWGVNYYPQSWNEYRFLKEQGIDFKTAIDADLDDLLRDSDPEDPNRINAIRIHVFDSEICDSQGNLQQNEHLDLLDYLVSKCNERGVYLWLTPIAWWGSPVNLPDNFQKSYPMQAMILSKETWPAQQRFLKSFLEHKNPYTKRRLVDEPSLNLFEIINEPLYWTLDQLNDLQGRPHGRAWPDKSIENTEKDPNIVFRKKIRNEWNEMLPDKSWESGESWSYFQYSRINEYINTMHETIRNTGAKQPIAYCAANFNTTLPAFQAIGDSRCEAITVVFYTGLQQKPVADEHNQLPKTADTGLPAMLANKARLTYEFDASDTLKQIDNYPAIARHFRNIGVQVACQFQYDSRFNASHNQAWPTHYLNAVHTPERFVSFLIGGETFRTLPRGTQYKPENPDEWIFPPTAVSYSRNAALLCKDQLYMQAKPTDWKPFDFSKQPNRIIGVGSTPYYDYNGSGIVDLKIDGNTALLRLNPDVVRLKNDTLRATPQDPLTRLENSRHRMKINLPSWNRASVEIQTESSWKKVADSTADFEFETDKTYRLKKEASSQ